jgi:hypothetical protein
MALNCIDDIFLQLLISFAFGEYGKTQSFGNKSAFIGILNTKHDFVNFFFNIAEIASMISCRKAKSPRSDINDSTEDAFGDRLDTDAVNPGRGQDVHLAAQSLFQIFRH